MEEFKESFESYLTRIINDVFQIQVTLSELKYQIPSLRHYNIKVLEDKLIKLNSQIEELKRFQ